MGVYLDGKLDFREHLQKMFEKISKTISLLRKLQNNLTRTPLATIYKSFIWPQQDYGDILYDQTFNNFFHERVESIQSNAALSITGAIRGSLIVKLLKNKAVDPYSAKIVQEETLFQNSKKPISRVPL